MRAGIDCIFPGPGRAPRKLRKPPDVELLSRLKRLEGVVQSLGVLVDEDGVLIQKDDRGKGLKKEDVVEQSTQDHEKNKNALDKNLGRLVISDDRSRYISSPFWSSSQYNIIKNLNPKKGLMLTFPLVCLGLVR